MSQVASWTSKFVWPDVSTEEGASRACSIGAMAPGWISSTYAIMFLQILLGGDLVGGPASDDQLRSLALASLGAAVVATTYLALRVWEHRCRLAAWAGFLWIGYEALNAMLGITTENPVVFMILLFAAFQGVRGCPFSSSITGSD